MKSYTFKNIFFFLTSLFIALTSSITFAGPGTPINKIVFFGDSLTDNGNLYTYFDFGYLPKSPPYYLGRFSNGPVWSETFANHYDSQYKMTSLNYAYGGQTTIFHNPIDGYLPYTFSLAITDYIWDTLFADRKNTLFVIWLGANDYLPTKIKTGSDHIQHDDNDEESKNINDLTTQVTEKIRDEISSLVSSHGARNFLIINLPDLGLTPYARAKNKVEVLHRFTIAHNEKLQARLLELEKDPTFKEVNIQLFDINDYFTSVITSPPEPNINTTDSCWQGGYTLQAQLNERVTLDIKKDLTDYLKSEGKFNMPIKEADGTEKMMDINIMSNFISGSPALFEAYQVAKSIKNNRAQMCENPNEYFFWDRVHPTAMVHGRLAALMIKFVDQKFQIAKN